MSDIILASHQPDFFPWMGYFYKMFQSDIFVFSDNVLFSKTGRHNYNDIMTGNGRHRFTIPIHYHLKNLNELKLALDDKGANKMLKTLWMAYRGCEHFDDAFPLIENLIMNYDKANSLADFNLVCIYEIAERFGLTSSREFHVSSSLDLKYKRDAKCIELCKMFGADTYISGEGAKDYHVEKDYALNGIKLVYANYEPVVYKQKGKDFEPNLSVIDYVMNCGFTLPKEWKRI